MDKPRRRLKMLDGLRGLALIAVVAYHVAPSAVPGGFLGVEVFFVLSGYLLASLLLQEVKATGKIDHTRFAYRRARRIVPALVVLLLGLVLLAPLLAPDDTHRLKGDVISSVAGMTNWRLIGDGNSYFNQAGRPPMVRHLWSIAIEIQFYLLCPLLVGRLASKTRFKAAGFLAGGIAVSAGLMAMLYRSPDPSRAYYGSETRISALLSGVLLAFLLLHGRKPKRLIRKNAGRWADAGALGGLAGLGALLMMGNETSRLMYPLGFLGVQASTLLVINGALQRRRAARLLERPPLRWLGRRSYGIYLWHWPAVVLLRPGLDVSLPGFVTAPLSILVAVVLGTLSYRFVEGQVRRPFPASGGESAGPSLRTSLAPLFRPVLRPAALLILLIALIGLSAGLPNGDPIAASLREGEKV
ncbi:MAG: acyltransferase family protein, partial [Actinomycetota bacterium]